MYLLLHTFCIILGANFLSFHLMFSKTQNGFLTQILQHNSCYFSNDSVFQQTFMYPHIYVCLNEKPRLDVFCEIT